MGSDEEEEEEEEDDMDSEYGAAAALPLSVPRVKTSSASEAIHGRSAPLPGGKRGAGGGGRAGGGGGRGKRRVASDSEDGMAGGADGYDMMMGGMDQGEWVEGMVVYCPMALLPSSEFLTCWLNSTLVTL